MNQQSQGVQQLLAAERRASDKVAEARKRKARRLKQAKDEAQSDIEKYRAEKRAAFMAHEASHMGSRDDIQKRVEADTRRQILEVNQLVAKNKDGVIEGLLALVYNIEAQLHKNHRAAYAA
ncbi:V-type proton ATPase subunit G-like [Tropilaelaps mercedesae]|uniref:V-type proton ATPase subunit G n=1 Tax=Tropilaelaps mercedesae TaxID=418985 RepID=A0A1V9XIB7_9ACAR|nr:V-type proton ATPase subunit G-like [Tropilaelaps mercedesae]